MIWDKPMYAFQPEEIQAAWDAWVAVKPPAWRTRDRLEGYIGHSPGAVMAALGMVSAAKKAGVIRWNGREWHIVEPRP